MTAIRCCGLSTVIGLIMRRALVRMLEVDN